MLYTQFFFFNSSFSNNTIFLLSHCVGMDDPEQGSLESGFAPIQGRDLTQSGVDFMFYWKNEDSLCAGLTPCRNFQLSCLGQHLCLALHLGKALSAKLEWKKKAALLEMLAVHFRPHLLVFLIFCGRV